MSVSSKAEGEASKKGLTGAAKRQYVGGAINRARHEKAESATPAARAKKQQHSYHREAVADARQQIRYHEAQIAGLREGVKLRRELAGAKAKRSPNAQQLEKRILASTLTPIRHVEGREINLAQPPDPAFLREVYGQKQLPTALDLFPTTTLRESAKAHDMSAGGSREALIARLAAPPTPRAAPVTRPLAQPKAKRTSDAAFADAVQRAVTKRENGSGFATFPQVREELRRETGLSDAAINNRLRKLRDEGDAGRAPLTLHFELDEDRMHRARRGQLNWRGHDFDFISVLPSVQEQKRRDAESMQRVRRDEEAIFRAHGMTPPVRDPMTGKVLRHAQPIKTSRAAPVTRPLTQPKRAKAAKRELIPVGRVDPAALDPYQPPNPHALRQLYGDEQLREALDRYSLDALKKSAVAHGVDPKASSKRVLVDRLAAKAQGKEQPPKPKRAPRPKKPPTLERQIAQAGGYVPKTPAAKLRKTPVREMTDEQLLRDWQNSPPERRRGVLEREMARRQAKAEQASKPAAMAQGAKKVPPIPRFKAHGPLVPIKEKPTGFRLDATRTTDPYFIREYFGDKQLPRALAMQTEGNLSEAVDVVEQRKHKRYTGSRNSRAEMYHWILNNM